MIPQYTHHQPLGAKTLGSRVCHSHFLLSCFGNQWNYDEAFFFACILWHWSEVFPALKYVDMCTSCTHSRKDKQFWDNFWQLRKIVELRFRKVWISRVLLLDVHLYGSVRFSFRCPIEIIYTNISMFNRSGAVIEVTVDFSILFVLYLNTLQKCSGPEWGCV